MVERNRRLALASAFDDLSRLLREVLKGVSAFNATAAAARGARGEGAAAGGGGGAEDGGGRDRASHVVGLEASPVGLGGVSPGVLQVSPTPSTSVVVALSIIAAPPPATELPIVIVVPAVPVAVVVPRAVPLMYSVVTPEYFTTAKCVHVAAVTVTVEVTCETHDPELVCTYAFEPLRTSLTPGVAKTQPAMLVALTQHSNVKSLAPSDGRPVTERPEELPLSAVDEP